LEKRKYIRYVTKDKLDKVLEENKRHIKKYFNGKNMNLSDSSKKSYESDFNQWLVFIHEKYEKGDIFEEDILKLLKDEDGIEEMVDLIEDYVAFCTSVLGNNERRIQRRMSSISSFFLFLLKKRRIKTNPLDYLERPTVRAGEKTQIKQTFLTKEQVSDARKKLKKSGDLQLECFFDVALSTMARVNALSNIKIEQIDFDKCRINDVLEKEGKVVSLFFSKKSKKLIEQLLKERKKDGVESEYLFIVKYKGEWKKVEKNTIQTNWVKRIGNIINVPELHAHDLRHSGSNLLFHSGMSLENVSLLLNHSGTDVTRQHYLQVNYDSVQSEKEKFEI
jgi:integrase/recombinase XerC